MLIRWTTSLMIVSGTNCKNPVEKQRGAIDHEGNQESGGSGGKPFCASRHLLSLHPFSVHSQRVA
jgi:hypothetical protein